MVTLEAVVNADITAGGNVEAMLPTKAEMDHAGSGKRPSYPTHEKLPVTAEWLLPALTAGNTWKQTVGVGNIENGYYQLAVRIKATGPHKSPYLIDKVYQQTWMFVTDAGVQLTPGFDETLFPENIAPQPGPFQTKRRLLVASADQPVQATAAQASMPNEDVFHVLVRYYADDEFEPASGVEVSAEYINQGDERGRKEKQIAPDNGIVEFSCPEDDYQVIEGGAATVTTDEVWGRHAFIPYWEADSDDCGDTISIAGLREIYMPWDILNNDVISQIDDRFGFDRSRITFDLDLSQEKSAYYKGPDKITFGTSYDDGWVVGHEYTHALHHESLGGIWYVFLFNCRNHRIREVSSYKCALKEGLADYGGSVIQPGRVNFEDSVTAPPSGHGAGEIEGNVAALFHDLLDLANEDDDETTYSGRYVMGVFLSCRTNGSKRDDVADIIWCMENRIDEDVHDDHFPGLSAPSSWSEGVTEPDDWDADDIRSTWIQNVG